MPLPQHRRSCRPSRVPPAAPSQWLLALQFQGGRPLGGQGSLSEPDSSAKPLPVSNLSKEPYPLVRGPGKSSHPGRKVVAASVPLPPQVSPFLCQGPLATRCGVRCRGWRSGVSGRVPQVYIGHVNKHQGLRAEGGSAQARHQFLPCLQGKAGRVEAAGLIDPQSPNFFNCKCYFLSREKCIYFKRNLFYNCLRRRSGEGLPATARVPTAQLGAGSLTWLAGPWLCKLTSSPN